MFKKLFIIFRIFKVIFFFCGWGRGRNPGCYRISWGAASICCKFVVKWYNIAGLFYYMMIFQSAILIVEESELISSRLSLIWLTKNLNLKQDLVNLNSITFFDWQSQFLRGDATPGIHPASQNFWISPKIAAQLMRTFNKIFCSDRITVEIAFGQMSRKWTIMWGAALSLEPVAHEGETESATVYLMCYTSHFERYIFSHESDCQIA